MRFTERLKMNCRLGIAVTAILECISDAGFKCRSRQELRLMKYVFAILILMIVFVCAVAAQDPGWPREKTLQGAKIVYYQPQIDDWKDYKRLDARMAISLTPAGGQPAVGVVTLRADTDVDHDNHTVLLSNLQITKAYFPSMDPAKASQMEQLVKSFLPPTVTHTIALERLVAGVEKSKTPPPAIPVKNDPPQIFVSYGPAILIEMDGQPVKAPIEKTKLETIVNSNWPLFFDKSSSKYYMFADKQWLTAGDLAAPWVPTTTLPKDMSKLKEDPNWEDLKGFIPPPAGSAANAPRVFYSDKPAEVLVFKGHPVYSKIPGTQLVYASNTESDIFVYSATNKYYYLTAGRWFSAASLEGPWTFATTELPPDFAKIPASSPAAKVLASVPGTPEAEDAILIAQIPQTAIVNPKEAAAKVKVSYYGEPQFKPIEGTSLHYAVNTPEKVIQVGDLYYLCFQGVWFMSKSAQGPWETAQSVPKEIYTIPASSPVYNVTYVTQTTTPSGEVEASYTAGYLGMFVTGMAVGAIITCGTGYYYPPYVGWGYGYPAYYPYARTYGYHGAYYSSYYGGAYGYSRGVYGAYGGASYGAAYNPYTGTYARGATAYGPYGSRSAGRAYNPYTGTAARGGSVSTPYGTRSAAQAYNPYTGGYGATRQGSNAYSQWGSSVATRGNQAVATQHYSDARGTVGSAQTSSGGRAVGTSTAYGNSVAGRTASGDMYAGRDGNVYKNTGGSWQKYDNGSWNNVNTTNRSSGSSSARAVNTASTQTLNQDFQNRQRGAAESQRFQSARASGSRRSFGGGRRR
jgi:hypothetical protein